MPSLLCKIEDIDHEDWENPQLCSDYINDIYQYLRQLEVGLWGLLYKLHGIYHIAGKENEVSF